MTASKAKAQAFVVLVVIPEGELLVTPPAVAGMTASKAKAQAFVVLVVIPEGELLVTLPAVAGMAASRAETVSLRERQRER